MGFEKGESSKTQSSEGLPSEEIEVSSQESDSQFKDFCWGDIEEDDLELDEDFYIDKDFLISEVKKDEKETYFCCHLPIFHLKSDTDKDDLYEKVMSFLQLEIEDCSINCHLNQLSCVHNCLYFLEEIEDREKANLLNSYLKFRHELISFWVSKYLILEKSKTDQSFDQLFGISSSRTPDFIIKRLGEMKCFIIEITAVTDYERGLRDKGSEEHGYKSKYDKEIEELKSLGYDCEYTVVAFGISKEEDKDHLLILENLSKKMKVESENSDLYCSEVLRKEFCSNHNKINKIYGLFYGSLFSEKFELYSDKSFDFMDKFKTIGEEKKFEGSYERVSISAEDYFKLYKNWFKLEDLFLNCLKRSRGVCPKFSIFLNVSNGKVNFREDNRGLEEEEIMEMIKEKNYSKACRLFSLKVGENYLKSRKPDLEFFQYQTKKDLNQTNFEEWESKHYNSLEIKNINFKEVEVNLEDAIYKKYYTKYEDEGYESKIIDSIMKMDLENLKNYNFLSEPFAFKSTSEKMIDDSVDHFKRNYLFENDPSGKEMIYHNKQPFIYPLYKISQGSYVDYKNAPAVLYELFNRNLGQYTNRIISIANQPGFKFGTNKKYIKENPNSVERANLQTEIFKKQKELYKINGGNFPKLKDVDPEGVYFKKLSEVNRKIREWEKTQPKNEINLIKLPTKRGTSLRDDFKKEMEHYKQKGSHSTYKGVGRNLDSDFVNSNINSLKKILMSPSGVDSREELYDSFVSSDVKLLESLKRSYMEKNEDLKNKLQGTHLYSSCVFISRLCHSLLYYSQTSMNSDYISIDNLGYDDSLLIVKGGKKIFPTKRSKLFRLVYPTYSSHANLFNTGMKTSFEVMKIKKKFFILTPWISFHETVLTDGLTMVQRCMGFLMLNMSMSEKIEDFGELMDKYIFNVLLALHARRQTEVFMHNMRYLTMNCISDFTALDEILPELAGFNYDCFQFYIREKVVSDFPIFAKKLHLLSKKHFGNQFKTNLPRENLRHFINGHKINSLEDLSTAVYSTYLMPKAPVTQTLEQVSNLKKVIETHDYYLEKTEGKIENTEVELEGNFEDYYNKLFEHDFKFDPKYCTLIGKFMGDYMSNVLEKNEASQKWESSLEKNWDSLANTKGLRGESDSNFFGEKGYHVVYVSVLKNNLSFLNDVISIFKNCEDYKTVKKNLKKMNLTYRKQLETEEVEELIFHFVDKIQRAGGREILVMDRKTKILQQPIENYCSYLCKSIPNEMISIPSNKRLSTIHNKVFEGGKPSNQRYYLVLDCRKWAPRSVIEKFLFFISGMRGFLPPGFVKHCYSFFYLMTKNKKAYTKPHIIEILKKNKRFEEKHISYFLEDKERKGFYFEMPYSWMMGIFNYLSSLMHVANQLHISHILKKVFQLKFNEDINLHMTAHSDDSAGKLDCLNLKHAEITLFLYETLMKSSNHMISKKKSNCGRVYYELISILYIAETLLSLLAKFTGMFNLHPTDEGYCSDVKEAYSKCTELVLNGSTFEQAYLGFKIQTNLIENFYFGKSRPKLFYEFPTSLMGIPDAHPLMILLCGSDSDNVRIFMRSDEKRLKMIYYLNKELSDPKVCLEGVFRPLICQAHIRENKRTKSLLFNLEGEKMDFLEECWSLKNCSFNNTAINLFQFLKNLKDPKFRSSLQNEMLSRRISRAYFFRSSKSVKTKYGFLSYKEINEMISIFHLSFEETILENLNEGVLKNVFLKVKEEMEEEEGCEFEKFKNFYELMYTENIRLCKYLNRLSFDIENKEFNQKTTKPLHIKIRHGHDIIPENVNVSNLCSWMKEPEYRNLLPDTRNYHNYEKIIKNLLEQRNLVFEEMTVEELQSLSMKIKGKSEAEYFCYSNVPHNLREVSNYQDILNFLSHNSFKNTYLRGITAQFGKNITQENLEYFKEFSEPIHWTICFLKIMNLFFTSEVESVKEIKIKIPSFLREEDGDEETEIKNFLEKLENYWKLNKDLHKLISLDLEKMRCKINNKRMESHILNDCYYHCFLRRQFLVDNVWLGKGEVMLSLGEVKLKLIFNNQNIEKVLCNKENYVFNNCESNYFGYVLKQMQMPSISTQMSEIQQDQRKQLFLGLDENLNLMVDKGENCSRGLNLDFDLNLRTKLSNPELGILKVDKQFNLKIEFKSFEGRIENYKIKSILVDSADCLVLLKNIVVNDPKNRKIMSEIESVTSKNLMEYLCEEMNIDLFLKRESLLQDFSSSRIYDILKFCHDNKICDVKPKYPYKKILPAPEGGVLNTLVKYSQQNADFKFNWNQEISPAYMEIKNSQPESFVSDLIGNLKNKFESLYDSEEKELILKSISKIIRSEDSENEIFDLMCTWGFVGVSGALDSLDQEGNQELFKIFRTYPSNFGFLHSFSRSFGNLLFAIYESSLERYKNTGNFFVNKKENIRFRMNGNNFKYYYASYFHSITLSLYNSNKISFPMGISINDFFAQELLKGIFSNNESISFFREKIKEDPNFSMLPVNETDLESWVIVYNTLKINYNNENLMKNEIKIIKPLERMENCQTPFDFTKSFLNKLKIKISPSKFYHHGVLNRSFIKNFDLPKFGIYRNQLTRIEFEIKEIDSEVNPPFCPFYWPKHVFTEDFLDSDEYYDMKLELDSTEPDLDCINDSIESFSDEVFDSSLKAKKVKILVNEKGKRSLQDVFCLKATVTFDFRSSGFTNRLRGLRQLGENIIIYTNIIYKELMELDPTPIILRCKESLNFEYGVIIPDFVYIIIMTNYPEVSFWENLLQAEKENEIISVSEVIRDHTGQLLDSKNIHKKDSLENYKELERQLDFEKIQQENSTKKILKTENNLEKYIEELKSKGENPDIFVKYLDQLKDENLNSMSKMNLLETVKSILSNEKLKKEILEKGKDIVKRALSNNEMTTEQHENIFIIPEIFRGYRSKRSDLKNTSLKEPMVSAELNSIIPNLSNKIISGSLKFSPKMKKRISNRIKLYRKTLTRNVKNKENKVSFCNLLSMILKDGSETTGLSPEEEENWDELLDWLDEKMLEEEEEDEEEAEEKFTRESRTAKLNYQTYGNISLLDFKEN